MSTTTVMAIQIHVKNKKKYRKLRKTPNSGYSYANTGSSTYGCIDNCRWSWVLRQVDVFRLRAAYVVSGRTRGPVGLPDRPGRPSEARSPGWTASGRRAKVVVPRVFEG